jgi:hypothetical protein
MATSVRIVHTYNVSEDTFWDKLFFDEEYNRRLYLEALKFHDWKVEKHEDKGAEVHHSINVAPRLGDLPGPMKKVLGDNIRDTEAGVLDKAKRRYKINIIPSALAGKLLVTGEMYTEPEGDNKCRRIFEAKVEVKVFGLGGMMEKRFVSDLEKSYAAGAKFTNQFAEEKGL